MTVKDNGGLGVAYLEAQFAETFHGMASDLPQMFATLGLATHDFEGGHHRSGSRRGDAGGEDIGADTVFHVVDGVAVGSDKTADRGQTLAKGAHHHIHIVEQAEVVARAASLAA